jgi:hypothetical protein
MPLTSSSRFPADSPAHRQAAALARGVFSGIIADQTKGATHFFAPVAQAQLGRRRQEPDPLSNLAGFARARCKGANKANNVRLSAEMFARTKRTSVYKDAFFVRHFVRLDLDGKLDIPHVWLPYSYFLRGY